MKKFGFTLAEVLITLGIIGVVAAVTMPTLVSNTKYKQVGVKLSKFHTNIENAARAYVGTNGDFVCNNAEKLKVQRDFINDSLNFKTTYRNGELTDNNRLSDSIYPNSVYTNGYYKLGGSYGILNDDTQMAFGLVINGSYYDTTKYSAEKYGDSCIILRFDPNVKGLSTNATKIYLFTITSKGLVFPYAHGKDSDDCTIRAYENSWKIDPSDYESGGICNNKVIHNLPNPPGVTG